MSKRWQDEDCLTEAEVVRVIERRHTETDRLRVATHTATCDLCFALVTEADRAGRGTVEATTLGDGRYALTGLLGRGGMGVVHRARDLTLDRDVAIKVLARAGSESGAHLLAESKAMARLRHPNVVVVHDVVLGPHGSFVVMEYVRGVTLRHWLAEHRPPWPQIVEMYARIGDGLAAAHRAGVVHRDFKPDNVLVDGDVRPQITDFGLAAAMARPADVAPAGEVGGTPAYMAPEQLVGGPVDARADIFAYAVSLWEALYGRRPFVETTVRARFEAAASGTIEPVAAGEVPDTVRALVLAGLRARPEDRPATMEDFVARLRAASPGATVSRRRPWRALVAPGLLSVTAIVALALLVRHEETAATILCDEELVPGPSALDPEAWAAIARDLGVDHSLWSRLTAEELHHDIRERAAALDRAAHDLCVEVRDGSLPRRVGAAGRTCMLRLRWRLDGALELASRGEVEALAQVPRLASPRWCEAWAREAVSTGLFERPPGPDERALERELARLEVRGAVRADEVTRDAARQLHERAERDGGTWSRSAARLVYARQLEVVDSAAAGREYEAIAAFATAHDDALHAATAWLARASLGVAADDGRWMQRPLQRARESIDRLSSPELKRAPQLAASILGAYVAAVEGRPEEALPALRAAQRVAGRSAPIFDARATRLLAEFEGMEGNAEAAIKQYRELLRWQEAQPVTPTLELVETLTELGWLQLEVADLDGARASHARALDIAGRAEPGSGVLLLTTELAIELDLQSGDLDRASARIAAHTELLESPSARLETRTARPRLLMQRERFDEAAAMLERIVDDTHALRPGNQAMGLMLVLPLACAHLRAGRPARARELLLPLLAWHERYYPRVRATAEANLVAGRAEAELGRLEVARERLTQAQEHLLDPRLRAWARFDLAVVEARNTGTTDALRREVEGAAATLAGYPALSYERRAIESWLRQDRR